MKRQNTTVWDASEHLETEEDMAAYLEAALEENDPALIAAALGDIARAKGMTQIAKQAGLGRESLYKALSPEGNPETRPAYPRKRLRPHPPESLSGARQDQTGAGHGQRKSIRRQKRDSPQTPGGPRNQA